MVLKRLQIGSNYIEIEKNFAAQSVSEHANMQILLASLHQKPLPGG